MVASVLDSVFPPAEFIPIRQRRLPPTWFEPLEQRTLLSATLYVTAPSVTADATHFQTLQAALVAANTGDTIDLQTGFSPGTFITTALTQVAAAGTTFIHTAAPLDAGDVVTIGVNSAWDTLERDLVVAVTADGPGDYLITLAKPLSAAHSGSAVDATGGTAGPTIGIAKGITLTADAGVVLPFNLEIWQTSASSQTVLSQLNLGSHALRVDGNSSTISNCTLGAVVVQAGAQSNVFSHNTINIPGANGLALINANGTVLDSNTINAPSSSAFGVMVDDSANVIITNNAISAGIGASALYVAADGMGITSADIRGNTLQTTAGTGLSLAKSSTTASLQARVQGNDFRANAVGVSISGDGISAGNIDLGGGSTVFGTSTGANNFSGMTNSDASDYAVGVFDTGASYYVMAKGNVFSTSNPLNIMADANHTPAAAGTGVVLATGSFVLELLKATVAPLSSTNGSISGTIATFTSNLSHVASDFTTVIDWGDGTSSPGVITANGLGGFAVSASHAWSDSGAFNIYVIIESNTGGNTLAAGTATVSPRVLTLTGGAVTLAQGATYSGIVATFTDSQGTTTPDDYLVIILWSDGTTSDGTISTNNNDGFSISASRSFSQQAAVTGDVELCTADGLPASAGANFAVTVMPRSLSLTAAASLTLSQGSAFSGPIATFTDSQPGTTAANYLATVKWSDGTTSPATVAANADGSFSVNTGRSFASAGALTATISLASTDGQAAANTTFSATVTPRTLTLASGGATTIDQNSTFTGVVADFADSKPGTAASDYLVTIAWSDGTTSTGAISANADGTFAISTSRSFSQPGSLTATIQLTSADRAVSATTGFTVTVNATTVQRTITMNAADITSTKNSVFKGVVASFTDSQAGTTAANYVASIAWSDGTTTTGTITKNADGSFSISTSRSFCRAGILVASVAVGTVDGSYSATANFTATITDDKDKTPHRCLHVVTRMIHHYEYHPRMPVGWWIHGRR